MKRFVLGMLLEVRPPIALAVALASLLGASIAGMRDFGLALLYTMASLMALFVAHYKDTYIDFWIRREYDMGYKSRFMDAGGVLRREELALAIGLFSGIFLVLMVYLVLATTWLLLPFMLVGFVLALVYVPYLDRRWFEILFWPLGVACVIWGGFVVQARTLALEPVALGLVIWWLLSFGKVLDSCPDAEGDSKLGKRTIPVILGVAKAKSIAYGGIYLGILLGISLCLVGLINSWLTIGFLLAAPIVAYSQRFDPRRGIMLVIMVAYILILEGIVVYLC